MTRSKRYRTAVSDKSCEISEKQALKRNPNLKREEVKKIDFERQALIDEIPSKRSAFLMYKKK